MAMSIANTENIPIVPRENIALHVSGAIYLLPREQAEMILQRILPNLLKSDQRRPGLDALLSMFKAFLRANIPNELKKKYGVNWREHLPPPHTDLIEWTANNIITEVLALISSKGWRLDAEQCGNCTDGVFKILGIAAIADPSPAGNAVAEIARPGGDPTN